MPSRTKNKRPGSFRIALPATSANLGPAFDAAALAMDFYIQIEATMADEFAIRASGRDQEICGKLENHLILNTYREVLESSGREVVPLSLRIANDIPFGLSASIQTTNLSRVFEFIHRSEAGLLTVNLPSAGVEYQLPFGGTKDSSFGPKEQGPAALDFYSDYKTIYLKY